MPFTVVAGTSSGGNWLSVSPTTGTAPANLSVTANTAGLAAGAYNGYIIITSPGASPALIGVGLLVAATLGPGIPIQRTGTPTNGIGPGFGGTQSIHASWTQAATYNYVVTTADFCSTNGSPASANWYITNAVGSGATTANLLASGTVFDITGSCTVETIGAVTPITSTLTLPPGTYYLVLSNLSANFGWEAVSGGASEVVASGVTAGADRVSSNAPPGYPPSDSGFVPLSLGSSSHVLLLKVAGIEVRLLPSTVPTLSDWALGGTAFLLLASGVVLMRSHAKRSMP